MSLLDYPLNEPDNPILCQDEIYVRYPHLDDFEAWATLRQQSRKHLQPYEPTWREAQFTKKHYKKRLRLYARDIRAGTARPYSVFREEDDAFLGVCTLSNIRYLSANTASLGYWIGEPFVRRGYTYSAIQSVITHGFDHLGLERIEAACLPANEASQNLLLKLGFEKEGYARKYLHINGGRRDHLLFGLLKDY